MKGADIGLISLYHQKIYDLHSNDFTLPIMDKIQNWNLDYFEVNNDQIIIQFNRYLITCDSEDYDIDTKRLKHHIMIAYNSNDELLSQSTDSMLSISQHSNTERKEISLFLKEDLYLNQLSNHDTINNDNNYIDYTIQNDLFISKKDGNTHYLCSMFNNTNDIYNIGTDYLDTTVQKVLHHVNLFICNDMTLYDPNPFKCGKNDDNYLLRMDCQIVMALAVGSSTSLPSEIHHLIQKGIYLIEIHFDLINIADNYYQDINIKGSGIRLYPDSPRQKSISIIEMIGGQFQIPPKQSNYDISFAMHSGCTNKYIPNQGVDILFIAGHMHYLGETISLERIRYPNKVEEIFKIKQWDFDRQFVYHVDYTLKKNDTLRVKCIFNSMNKDNITYEGEQSNDEMCRIYLGVVEGIDDLSVVYSKPVYGNNMILNPSYCGSTYIRDSWSDTQLTENIMNVFPNQLNIKSNNDNLDILSRRNELCHALIYDHIDMISNDLIWRFSLPYITLPPAIILIIVILFSLFIIQTVLKLIKPGVYMEFSDKIQDKRKVNIYVLSVIYFSIILVILLINATSIFVHSPECEIIHNDDVSYPDGIPFVANMIIIFFGLELFYRLRIKWDLILHHMLTIIIIICITTTMQTTLNAGFLSKIAFYYLLQIATEQPIFIALFVRKLKLKVVKQDNYPKMFYFSCIWHYITKISTTIIIIYYYLLSLIVNKCEYWHIYDISYASFLKYNSIFHPIEEVNWKLFSQISMGLLLLMLFILQMYQGYGYYILGRPNISKTNVSSNEIESKEDTELIAITEQITTNQET